MTVHEFAPYLTRANGGRDRAFWVALLPKLFPGFASVTFLPDDGAHQREGIDAIVVLRNAGTLAVDLKLREQDWPDVLIEFCADEARGQPGWVLKALRAAYVVYAWRPSASGVLLPVLQLQEAWRRHGDRWRAAHGVVRAENADGQRRWTTLSCPVPETVLWPAIGGCLRVGRGR